MMQILLSILLTALLQGPDPDNSIALSVSATPNPVRVSQSVTLIITLTNKSDEPRYVRRDLSDPLEFAVRASDGKLVHWFSDPPPPPPLPKNPRELVRIESKRSIGCSVEMPLADLGIKRAGLFSLTGFWQGISIKMPEVDLTDLHFSFTHSETMKLTVTGGKSPANIGLQRTAGASTADLAKCTAAETDR